MGESAVWRWVVSWKDKWFLGKVLKCVGSSCLVRCLEKLLSIKEPQDMEPKADALFYDVVYETGDIQPKLVKINAHESGLINSQSVPSSQKKQKCD